MVAPAQVGVEVDVAGKISAIWMAMLSGIPAASVAPNKVLRISPDFKT